MLIVNFNMKNKFLRMANSAFLQREGDLGIYSDILLSHDILFRLSKRKLQYPRGEKIHEDNSNQKSHKDILEGIYYHILLFCILI